MRAAPEIKGWCPGALSPMQSGDGLLMRAKIIGAALTLEQAGEVAQIAQDCGGGLIDLTQRAQLQMRGFSAATVARAQMRLASIGLLSHNAATEAMVNVIASPLPTAAPDVDAFARRLAQALEADAALLTLPGKFLFLIDGGGAFGLADVEADIRLEASGEHIALSIAGARDLAAICSRQDAIGAALALARVFIALREPYPFARRRMRALVAELGAESLFRAAGLAPKTYASNCSKASLRDLLGANEIGAESFLAAAAPFGRFEARRLKDFVVAATAEGATQLRLTPWRAIVLPCPSLAAAERLARHAQSLNFIVAAEDWRLSVVACPGAPECPQALGQTRRGLDRVAKIARALSRDSIALHVSGCAKGCAKPSKTPLTLVANGAGFDFAFDGAANDPPQRSATTLDEIADILAARSKGETPCRA